MQDKLIEAHARLSALKIHLPDTSLVEERYVREFHTILAVLEEAFDCDLDGYRVPHREVVLRGGNGNGGAGSGLDGESWCALEPACDRNSLMIRIEGVLSFFGIQANPRKF